MLFHYWVFMIPTCCVLLSMKWLSFSLCLNSLNWLRSHTDTHTHTRLFFFFFFAAAASICCSVLWQWLFLHLSLLTSVSIPLFHCLFTSLHRPCGIALSPLATSYSVFSHSSSRLAITAYLLSPPSPVSCRVHRILSALSGTMATRKLL